MLFGRGLLHFQKKPSDCWKKLRRNLLACSEAALPKHGKVFRISASDAFRIYEVGHSIRRLLHVELRVCMLCIDMVLLNRCVSSLFYEFAFQAACQAVTAIMQYFFLSSFCWMMCEGIMLYLMLVVVFTGLSKKWWFFLLLGWSKFLQICHKSGNVRLDKFSSEKLSATNGL